MQPSTDQNNVLAPFPVDVTTEMANTAKLLECTAISRPAHGQSDRVFSNQSHRIWYAQPMISRLWIPRPPRSMSLLTFSQATRQQPPFTSFLPFHRNPFLILSIALMNHFGTLMTTSKYKGNGSKDKAYQHSPTRHIHERGFPSWELICYFLNPRYQVTFP